MGINLFLVLSCLELVHQSLQWYCEIFFVAIWYYKYAIRFWLYILRLFNLFQEESLATLELEYNIQTGIAEAARSLASDSTASKGARRKHRLVYQQSQRRLLEVEARLNLLRQASRCPLKQRKKPRPPLESGSIFSSSWVLNPKTNN